MPCQRNDPVQQGHPSVCRVFRMKRQAAQPYASIRILTGPTSPDGESGDSLVK